MTLRRTTSEGKVVTSRCEMRRCQQQLQQTCALVRLDRRSNLLNETNFLLNHKGTTIKHRRFAHQRVAGGGCGCQPIIQHRFQYIKKRKKVLPEEVGVKEGRMAN